MSSSPLEVRGLSVAYGVPTGTEADAALWNASVAVRPGALTAIVGPNGAGKTTLLHAALGLVPVLAGEVRFWGGPLSAARRRVAFLPQRETIDWDFPITAGDVVAMGATGGYGWWVPTWARRLVGGAPESKRAAAALARVGMDEYARRPIGDLSGGQQQRVFLARALAQDADLVLLDEPFAGIDATTEEVLLNELRAMVQEGRTVVAVHHDLDTVQDSFDDAILVQRTVLAQGPVDAVLASEAFRVAFARR